MSCASVLEEDLLDLAGVDGVEGAAVPWGAGTRCFGAIVGDVLVCNVMISQIG